jgi:thiol-disulfide isomerase/thioredoxin
MTFFDSLMHFRRAFIPCIAVGLLVQGLIGAPSLLGAQTVGPTRAADSTSTLTTVGQPSGEWRFPVIVNGPVRSGALSTFRGKLLILDFWATWCSPCIGAMPHVLSLQKQFGANVQFLLVTDDDLQTVRHFYAKRPELALATAIGDHGMAGTLMRRFGAPTMGTYVWIDSAGIVRAITGAEDVTPEHIQAVLEGKPVNFTLKAGLGVSKPLNGDVPLMADSDSATYQDVVFRSVLTPVIPGKGASVSQSSRYGDRQLRFVNNTAIGLLAFAMGGAQGLGLRFGPPGRQLVIPKAFPDSRTKIEVTDSLRLTDGTRSDHLYSYELIVPSSRVKDRYHIMLAELQQIFGVSAAMEHRRTPVYVLTKVGAGPAPSHGGKAPEQKPLVFQFWNEHAPALARRLEDRFKRPVFDETGVTTSFDLEWDDLKVKDVASVRHELQQHGLDLREEIRDVELFVIKDAP